MKPASSADSPPSISNYRFVNGAFLNEALTHKSYVNEQRASGQNHNERLEFLGDAVLSLIVSDYLASRYPELSEGALSQLKAKLVSEAPLAKAARRLDLGARLNLVVVKSSRKVGRNPRCLPMAWRQSSPRFILMEAWRRVAILRSMSWVKSYARSTSYK